MVKERCVFVCSVLKTIYRGFTASPESDSTQDQETLFLLDNCVPNSSRTLSLRAVAFIVQRLIINRKKDNMLSITGVSDQAQFECVLVLPHHQ